mmetsp:Transcript_72365/g.119141  ORF Transcript_72365/g.119141 Transcript_72365/m.119141 type:complete len:127 (+) Transcript_72365:133-513(+)
MALSDRYPRFMNEEQATNLYQRGRDFLRAHKRLTDISQRIRRKRWLLKPKFHAWDEQLYRTKRWRMNARFTAGWLCEDHMGLLKKLSRKASAKHYSHSVLKMVGFRLLAFKYRVNWLNSQARKRSQ